MGQLKPTILFTGGGTGGHVLPNLAVLERLRGEEAGAMDVFYACSYREIDEALLGAAAVTHQAMSVRPIPARLRGWPRFGMCYLWSRGQTRRLMRRLKPACVVSTGGFVSGPVVLAAEAAGVASVLMNLDAVPGRANRWLAPRARRVFSVYDCGGLPAEKTERIAMPLAPQSVGPTDSARAKAELGYDAARPLLLVTGGSLGAQSLNQMMMRLAARADVRDALGGWQVMHLAGDEQVQLVQQAYLNDHVEATVMNRTDRMGMAWAAADLAISRAGAGAVAEVVANAVPTIFLPYPHHRDQHQRRNTETLVDADGAMVFDDHVDPQVNAEQHAGPFKALLGDGERRGRMAANLRSMGSGDGASRVAQYVRELIGA
ncbi:MAG: hypothetical protein CMJ49_03085 [Planctomycetaceae bacterium]|nr:hypothetical protein [Planctomycetaceae bacterium]